MALSTLALLHLASTAAGYNNGLGKLPPAGWSSWYAAPDGSQVTEAFVQANAQVLLDSGLSSFYRYVNVDEGWLASRGPDGLPRENLAAFPSGMAGLGAWLKGKGLEYGLYTCRGTCQCGTDKYSGPGSHGYEKGDVDWMVAAGATWLKVDSCCGSQDHATAFSDYAKFRDALNATGVPVYFNLCGWYPFYSPPDPALNYTGGGSLGNSFRIYNDGGSWPAITGAINTMAALAPYNAPYGWNDPDNILGPHGTVGRVTEAQALVQMILWCLAPTQLILGEDLTQASPQYLATVGNAELLAINQDWPYAGPGRRDWAVDAQQATVQLLGGGGGLLLTLSPAGCASAGANGSPVLLAPPGSGGGGNSSCSPQTWVHAPSGNLVGPFGKCLDEYQWTTPVVDLWACLPGAANEVWTVQGRQLVSAQSGKCLTAVPVAPAQPSCTNVWARPLSTGATALAFVSNLAAPANVTCDASCFAAANVTAARVRVRDVVAHADLGVLQAPFSLTVLVGGGGGNGEAVVLTPF